MKSLKFLTWAFLVTMMLSFVACEKEDEAPELPPYETMAMDFSSFKNDSKSAKLLINRDIENALLSNRSFAKATVDIWNTILFITLAVPVASFKTSFTQVPVFLGKRKWQWSYAVKGVVGQYNARLTGEVRDEDVLWEMYISRTGVNAFSEILWFSGVAKNDRSSGYWILNHSAQFPEEMLRIDWQRESDEVGYIKCTYVRELNNQRETDKFKDSYIEHGVQDSEYNMFYNVHAFDIFKDRFVDTEIEWSKPGYFGRVKAFHFFNDEDWHCWDENWLDADCE